MADKKVSAFDAAATLDGTEVVDGVQAGGNVKITTQAIADLAAPGGGSSAGSAGTLQKSDGASGFAASVIRDVGDGTLGVSIVGQDSPSPPFYQAPSLLIYGNGGANGEIGLAITPSGTVACFPYIEVDSFGAGGNPVLILTNAEGTPDAPTPVTNLNTSHLGTILFGGYAGGASYSIGASITATPLSDFSGTASASMSFITNPSGVGFTLNPDGTTTFDRGILAAASTTAAASLNLAPGVAPTSPADGDMWVTTAGLFVRVNGSTIGPLS